MEYLRNTWYAVAWSDEIGDQPFGRKVIEDPLVIYRTADGGLHVLRDMCPHRFAPLSKGKIISDQLQCPYHGLRFNSNGQCVFNPHGDGVVPKAAVTRTYPRSEEHTSELQSLMRISYAVFCLKKKKKQNNTLNSN